MPTHRRADDQVHLSISLPLKLYLRIEREARRRGTNKSAILRAGAGLLLGLGQAEISTLLEDCMGRTTPWRRRDSGDPQARYVRLPQARNAERGTRKLRAPRSPLRAPPRQKPLNTPLASALRRILPGG